MLGRLLGWRGEAYLYVNGRLIIFICWQRGSEQLVCETRARTCTRKEEWETPIECLVIRQLFFCLFCAPALMTEERNNTEKTEGEGERERSVLWLPAPAGLTSPEYSNYQPYSLLMSCQWERGREREKKREGTSSGEDQFCNFLITFLATFACAVVNASNWMFLWFLSK